MKHKIGDNVSVITCGGIFNGRVKKYLPFSFVNETAYQIEGPNIITVAKESSVQAATGMPDKVVSTCHRCNSENCPFRSKPQTEELPYE